MRSNPPLRVSFEAEPVVALPVAVRRGEAPFVAAVENASLLEEIRRLLEALLGQADLETIPQDGPVALSQLRGARTRLTFLPMDLRLMEGLTLLRALPPSRARRVVLLVPDTVEGYRVAWEALCLGARDFMVTRGAPPQRLKGGAGARLRQLAHLIADDESIPEASRDWAPPPARLVTTLAARMEDEAPDDAAKVSRAAPWMLLPESRHLGGLAPWLRSLPSDLPAVVRVPEGARCLRVVREGLGRLVHRPVRELSDGDRLVPGHVHLWTDQETLQLCGEESFLRARLVPLAEAPGTWGARREVLTALIEASVPLVLALPESDLTEEEDLLATAERHTFVRLEAGPLGRGPESESVPGSGSAANRELEPSRRVAASRNGSER